MFKKKQEPEPVGAKAKRARAEMMRQNLKDRENLTTQGAGPRAPQPVAAPLVLIYGLSVVLALMLIKSGEAPATSFQLPFLSQGLNALLFSRVPPDIYGDKDIDMVIASFVRGFFIFLAAGIVPLATRVFTRLVDKAQGSPYVAFWGVSVGLPFIWILMKEFITPVAVELVDMMTF